MAEKKTLDFHARVTADVKDVKDVVDILKTQLENLKLPAGATKNFEKSFERLEGQIRDFESLTSSGVNSLADTKKVQAAWDKVSKSFNSLSFSLRELDTISDQIFPKEVSENIKKANDALGIYQNKLKEIKDTEKYKAKKAQIGEAEKEVTRTRTNYSSEQKKLANKRDEVTGLEKAWAPRAEEYEKQAEKVKKLNEEYQNLSNTLDKMRADKAALESIGAIDSSGKVSSKYKNLLGEKKGELADLEDEAKLREKTQGKQLEFEERIKNAQDKLRKAAQYEKQSKSEEKKAKWIKEQAEAQEELNAAQNDSKNFTASIEARKEALREEINIMKEHIALAEQVTQIQINEQSKKTADKGKELRQEEENETFKDDKKLKKNLETASAQLRTLETTSQSAKDALDTAEKAVEDLNNELNNIETDGAKNEWQEVVNTLKQFTDVNLDETKGDIEAVKKILENYTTDEIKKTPEVLEKLRQAASGAEKPIRDVGNAADDTADHFKEMDRAARDMDNLKDQILDFFSISNTIQIFKDAIRDAFETVKELDAAMTETAVVTDFSIGDMWDKLPEYSEQATKLGASIKELYNATTLYYQQGLNSEQAMSVGIETMKMARIAGMDATEATTAMTAALRGFNMEINEMSATRINDVYSELAAITAADTNQIATAMKKTASIAASANMEFETTAALLAQIIETTQEAPETAGTAMKTIIARFTEVKELFNEGMLIGEDDEGEEININKIDAALKSVGISLKDFLNGTKGIDDIFLELASKWDSLDLATQRYIATTAAGSRQQSRFLAMMSNYDRTMELVTAANNSAGASQSQFDKTTESLAAKLQRLKNAWDTFVMGLANNQVIKASIDLLTDLLNTINNLTDVGGSKLGKFATSLLRLVAVFAGLKTGQGILNGFLRILGDSGVAKIFGLNMADVGKIDFFSAFTKFSETMKTENVFSLMGKGISGVIKGLGKLGAGILKFLISPMGLSLIAITAVIYAVNKLVKAFQAAQKETKLTSLNESINQLSNETEEAKSELNEIADARSNLQSLEDTFEGLTQGTDEWKEALVKVNGQVLELIEKYPILSGYITTGKNGQMTIEAEGWEELTRQQTQIITNLTGQTLARQAEAKQLASSILSDEYIINNGNLDGIAPFTKDDGVYTDYDKKATEYTLKFLDFMDSWLYKEIPEIIDIGNDGTTWAEVFYGREMGQSMNDDYEQYGGVGGLARYVGSSFLTEKQLINLATALQERGIYAGDKEGIDAQDELEIEKVYKELGFSPSSFSYVLQMIKETGTEFDRLGQATMGLTAQQERYAKSFVTNAVNNTEELNNLPYGDAIANFVAETSNYNTDLTDKIGEQVETLRQIYNKGGRDENGQTLQEAYAQENGYVLSSDGKIYTDSTYTQLVQATTEDMLKALASADITLEIQQEAIQVSNFLAGKSDKQKELFDDLFSEGGAEITAAQVSKYLKEDDSADYASILKDLGWKGGTERDLVNFLGDMGLADKNVSDDQLMAEISKGINALESIAEENLKIAEQRIKKERASTAFNMASHNKQGWQTPEFNSSMLLAFETKFGEEFRYVIDNVISSLENSGDEILADKGYQLFQEAAMERSASEVTELANFINSINWNDPIDAAHSLNQELKSGSGITQEYAQQIMEIDASFLSASSQMQSYFNSEEFKEVNAELAEIIEQNGEITSTDVETLTGKYSKLNKMLKNTGMSASALAKTLDLIGKGKLNLQSLTEPVLALLKNFDSLGSLVDETISFIDNFDAGPDENKAAEFLKTGSETILGNLKKGAWGNSQNYSYLDALFPGWDEGKTAEERVAEMERLGNKMKANSENMLNMWSDLASNTDGGMKNYKGETSTLSDANAALGIDVQRVGNEIVLTGYEGKTTEQLVNWIADAYDVSNNMAKLMLTDFKNYSEDLAYELMENDFTAGIQAAAEELQTWDIWDHTTNQPVEKKIISENEITAMSTVSGKSREEVIAGLGGESELIITNFRKANGELEKTADVLTDIASKSGFKTSKEMLDSYQGKNGLALSTFQENLGTWGLSEAEQRKVIEDTINARVAENGGKGITIEAILPDGTAKAIENVTSYSDYEAKVDVEITKAQAGIYAEAFSEALSNITVDVDQEQLKNSIIAVIEEAGQTTKLVLGLDETALGQMGGTIQSTLDGESPTVAVYGKYQYTSGIPASITIPAVLDFSDSPGAEGAAEGSNADGVKNSPRAYDSLVSEEGPELIQKADGGAYLTGQEGPEIVHLDKGDTVYTAEETESILKKRNHTLISRYEGGGVHGYGGVSSGGSGSSVDDDDEDTWENPFDKLYNLVRKIDEELRQRERIERRYEKLLSSIDVSANAIVKVSREELAQLDRERAFQESLVRGRRQQINQYQSENADLTKYANVVKNDRGEDVLRIDWDLINSVTDTDEGDRIEEYVSQLEEWFDSLEEAEDALWDIEDAVEEIKERGEEEYFDMEDTIKEALTQSYQDEIDKLDQINESINETNSSLLDAIQKTIDKQRQDRDNQRTEDDLAEKQRRLLYLQQDTSGANAMEILRLQEEIAQGQEDYTDALIDQKISELQDQNDEAAKQREQQITIAQSQLDHYIETGRIWQEVYSLMDDGLDKDAGLVRGSRLEEILKNSDNFTGMSEIAKMEWLNDTNNMIAQALAYLEIGRQLEDIGTKAGSQIEFTTTDGRVLTGIVNSDGSVTASDGSTYNNVYQGHDGKYYAGENITGDRKPPSVERPSNNISGSSGNKNNTTTKKNNPYGVASEQGNYTASGGTMWSSGVKAIQWALNDMGYDAGTIDGGYGYATSQAVRRFQSAEGIQVDGDYGSQTREKMRLRGYKTGGLADFTGPAWLDGTKARPELVLNQRDTQNFIQLKDILASLMTGSHTSTENNGDITYDIDINVESIGSDYDVEQVANKVKSLINEDARYRNNNAVSLKR